MSTRIGGSVIRVAAVQAASVFLDAPATVAKAVDLIREAGANGAKLVAFPEGFIPAHPGWFHFHAVTSPIARNLSVDLFNNSLEIPGPETMLLGEAARDAGAFVVLGVCERVSNTDGTLFNTQLYIGPDGDIRGKHQKIMPTVGERLVHTGGFGDTFGVVQTPFGRVSSLVCGENANPLAVFALAAQHTRIHVMSWPHHFNAFVPPLSEHVRFVSQAFANMAKCYVVSSCGVVDDGMIEKVSPGQDGEQFLRNPASTGGSVIVAPSGDIVAGPLDTSESILYGDIDLDAPMRAKIAQDYAGHYNRPDIFQLQLNRRPGTIMQTVDEPGAQRASEWSTSEVKYPAAGTGGARMELHYTEADKAG